MNPVDIQVDEQEFIAAGLVSHNSDIKGLEYSAMALPFVAQSIDSYDELHKTGVGRVAKNAVEWTRHLRALRSPEVRAAEGAKNRAGIATRDIKYGINDMIEVFSAYDK